MAYYRGSELSGSTFEGAVTSTGVLFTRRSGVIGYAAGDLIAVQSVIILPSGTNFALNDVVELCYLPADHIMVDYLLTCDQLDSNAAATFAVQIGVMTGTPGDTTRTQTSVGSEGGTAIKIGGSTTLNTTRPGFTNGAGNNAYAAAYFAHQWNRGTSVAPVTTNADRTIGLTVTTAAATNPATARRIDFTSITRAGRNLG